MFERLLARLHLPDHAREWLQAFSRFVWRRFVEDSCFETAAVLAYVTLFAVVPLAVAVFGVIAAFPLFKEWNETLSHFLFTHFVPGAANAVEEYVKTFAESAGKLTGAGILGVLFSALIMMKSAEDTFNRIWRVTTPRSRAARFLVYWTALTLGPLLVAASLALSSWILDLPFIQQSKLSVLTETLLLMLPFAVELGAFTLMYALVPNQPVQFRHALTGGLLASLLFELAKAAFAAYLRNVPSYEQIYGALSVLPIFLLWIYLSWTVVLLGASIAASLSAFRFQPKSDRLPADADWIAALRLLTRLLQGQKDGRALALCELRQLEPSIDDDALMRLLGALTAGGFLQRNASGEWLLARDPQQTRLSEIYALLQAHLPVHMPVGPGTADVIGQRAAKLVRDLQLRLAPALEQPLAILLPIAQADPAPRPAVGEAPAAG